MLQLLPGHAHVSMFCRLHCDRLRRLRPYDRSSVTGTPDPVLRLKNMPICAYHARRAKNVGRAKIPVFLMPGQECTSREREGQRACAACSRVRRRGVACSALVLRLRWQLLALLKLLILVLLVLRRAPWRQAELQAAALCCLPGASASPVVYTWAPCQACSCPPIAHHAAPHVSCRQCTACVCAVPDMLV